MDLAIDILIFFLSIMGVAVLSGILFFVLAFIVFNLLGIFIAMHERRRIKKIRLGKCEKDHRQVF